ncbi:hypothetical protein E2C01_072113 [Portunus trituberculatus]|uniref:Uncharacterized protein n=1 Tax=Portunus trituberculatus TaxID=210409 RepID=A0A5B7IA87_PORTR|nr:hypothetical protein [Portunus trituberculatus]
MTSQPASQVSRSDADLVQDSSRWESRHTAVLCRALLPRVPLVWPRPQHYWCGCAALGRPAWRHTPTFQSGCELASCWACVAVAPSLTCRLPSHTSAAAPVAAAAHSGRGSPMATCCLPACWPAVGLHPTLPSYICRGGLRLAVRHAAPPLCLPQPAVLWQSRRGRAARHTAPALCRAPRSAAATHRNTLVSLSPTFISFPDPSDLTCDPGADPGWRSGGVWPSQGSLTSTTATHFPLHHSLCVLSCFSRPLYTCNYLLQNLLFICYCIY